MLILDGEYDIMSNDKHRLIRRNTKTVAVASFFEGSKFLLLPSFSEGGDIVYITLEQLLLIAAFIVALLQYVHNIYHNKKK